jgi:broad specificity phosphatase PhoE
MIRLLLVRHGHVAWLAPERFRGRADLPLSELGLRQVEAAARRIAATASPAAVYTSPLGRCVDTGAAIGARFGLEPRPLEGLVDTDCGAWQGLTRDEVHARWPAELDAWLRAPHLAAIPGGESLARVEARLTGELVAILARHADETVVLVGHDSSNRVLLLHALGLPLSRYWHLRQDPCAVNDLEFAGGDFVVRGVNGTWHLDGV